jgi:hypothetical protein
VPEALELLHALVLDDAAAVDLLAQAVDVGDEADVLEALALDLLLALPQPRLDLLQIAVRRVNSSRSRSRSITTSAVGRAASGVTIGATSSTSTRVSAAASLRSRGSSSSSGGEPSSRRWLSTRRRSSCSSAPASIAWACAWRSSCVSVAARSRSESRSRRSVSTASRSSATSAGSIGGSGAGGARPDGASNSAASTSLSSIGPSGGTG